MVQLLRGPLVLFALLSTLAGLSAAAGAQPRATGWDVEKRRRHTQLRRRRATSTDLNIDSIVLSCEQGPSRRGLQLRVYLLGNGPLAPRSGGTLKGDPTLELVIDGQEPRRAALLRG